MSTTLQPQKGKKMKKVLDDDDDDEGLKLSQKLV